LAESARLNESRLQIDAIRQGMLDVISEEVLNLLTWKELESRVCGKPEIDIDLLKRHTVIMNVQSGEPYIDWFWQILEEFSQEERRALIRFAWAQERLPEDDEVSFRN
jgi:hypothetical protein